MEISQKETFLISSCFLAGTNYGYILNRQNPEKIKSVKILDLNGREVINPEDFKDMSIDISELTKGVYIMRIES